MKLLLTSGGVSNDSIRRTLIDLLGRPIAECDALVIPTAQYGHPACTPIMVRRSIADGMTGLGWRSVGVLELTALPSMGAGADGEGRWLPWVREADALLVDGGDATYLAHWMRASGLAELLPTLSDTVYVGMSAGSMVLTPRIGDEFVAWPAAPDDRTLGIVDFSIFPHLDYPGWSSNTTESARRWGRTIGGPAYAIDDQTAIVVRDGDVRVVSEGNWELLNPR